MHSMSDLSTHAPNVEKHFRMESFSYWWGLLLASLTPKIKFAETVPVPTAGTIFF
jgi:hypothetical protein